MPVVTESTSAPEARQTADARAPGRLERTLQAFHSYNFRLYWFGLLVSQIGTWMQSVAQAWLVLQLDPSPLGLGTVTALQFLPITFGSFLASVLADRIPKRRLLFATQSAALTQAVVLAVLAASGQIQLWHVYVLALSLGCINAVDAPARQAFLPELVERENLVNAVGLNAAVNNSARLVGPAVGGLAIAAWGVPTCFGLNAVSFLAVLAGLALMRPTELPAGLRRRARGSMPAELAEGLRFVRGDPELAGLVIALAGLGIFGFNYSTVIPLFATGGLGLGPEGFGLLQASVGVGSLAAAVGLAGAGHPRLVRTLVAGAAFGVLEIGASQAGWFPVALVLVAGFAFVGTWFSMSSNSMLQLRSPEALRGRVMGLYTTLVMGATPPGALLTSVLANAVGIRLTMLTWGSVCVAAVVLGYAQHRRALGTHRSWHSARPEGTILGEAVRHDP